MREIVLDTETTGLNPKDGHRVIELGCLELINHLPSGRTFHSYFNPEREVPFAATEIHGLTWDDLKGQPIFAHQVDLFLEFIANDRLVIHNAEFDLGFLNAELGRLNLTSIGIDRAVDTLKIARQKYPGAPASLDALCRKFSINNAMRDKHGALLDADLLAQVYVELIDARQPALGLSAVTAGDVKEIRSVKAHRQPRVYAPSQEELLHHRSLLKKLTKPIWLLE